MQQIAVCVSTKWQKEITSMSVFICQVRTIIIIIIIAAKVIISLVVVCASLRTSSNDRRPIDNRVQ
jgi:hypothetical protein